MSRHWRDKPANRSLPPPICFLEGKRDEEPRGALDDSDFPVHKTVVKDNAHVGFDQILVDWIVISAICMLAQNPSIIACTRREIISNALTFSR
jgi:hypothetical protein